MDCIIYYELVERSYDNFSLIQLEMERRGYSVKIVNLFWRDYWKCLFYRPKIILAGGCRSTSDMAYQAPFLFKKNLVWINIQEEQVAFANGADLKWFLPSGRAKEAYHFCWGDFAENYMRKADVAEDHIVSMKPIQFDLCHSAFDDYFFDKEYIASEFGLDIYKKWILFASDFCSVSECSKESNLQNWCEEYGEYRKDVHYYETQSFLVLVEWWDRFLIEHEDTIIIYRPHPSEYTAIPQIAELCEKYNNFICCKKYSIKQWIKVIDIYTTWISTSIIEANQAGKPCFALCAPNGIMNSGFAISIFEPDKYITSYEDMRNVLENPKEYREKWFPLNRHEVENYFGKEKHGFAYIAICDYLESILSDKTKYNHMKMRLSKKEKKSNLNIKRYIKITFWNDVLLLLYPVLRFIIPWKRKGIERFKKGLTRFDDVFLRTKQERLKKIVDNMNGNEDY